MLKLNLRPRCWWVPLLLWWLVACQAEPLSPTPTTVALPTATPGLPVQAQAPLPLAQAQPPVRLAIPAIDFATTVIPMAWQVTEVAGERRAVWQVPLTSAGWHINTAGAGAAGNVVISGHHRLGAGVFAPLARGAVKVGQQVLLTDAQGQIFVYRVTTIAEPIPTLAPPLGARPTTVQVEQWLAPTDQAQLTLVTGWPEFSNTHTLVIIAQFAGLLAP